MTIAADRKHLKHLFRDCDHLKTIMGVPRFREGAGPYDNHSRGGGVREAGRHPAYERCRPRFIRTRETVDAMVHDALAPRPLEQLEDYSVFTDCSFRSTHNKKYQRGGRMGIAGVSEDGFYFHSL